MATTQSKEKILVHGPLKKNEGSLQAVESNHAISTIHFALQQDQDQRGKNLMTHGASYSLLQLTTTCSDRLRFKYHTRTIS